MTFEKIFTNFFKGLTSSLLEEMHMEIMSLKNFSLIVKSILFLLKVAILCLIIKYVYDVYQVIHMNIGFLSHLFSQDGLGEMLGASKDARANNIDGAQKLGIYLAKLSVFLVIKWIILGLIIKLIKALPVPSKLIANWVENNELNLTLGRYLASNFRLRTKLSIKNLFKYMYYADLDRYHLYHAHKNENIKKLMSRYQTEYIDEIDVDKS